MNFRRILPLFAVVLLAGCGAESQFQQAWNAYRSKHSMGTNFPVYEVACTSVTDNAEYEVFFCDFKYENLEWGGAKTEKSRNEPLIHFKKENIWKINKKDA